MNEPNQWWVVATWWRKLGSAADDLGPVLRRHRQLIGNWKLYWRRPQVFSYAQECSHIISTQYSGTTKSVYFWKWSRHFYLVHKDTRSRHGPRKALFTPPKLGHQLIPSDPQQWTFIKSRRRRRTVSEWVIRARATRDLRRVRRHWLMAMLAREVGQPEIGTGKG